MFEAVGEKVRTYRSTIVKTGAFALYLAGMGAILCSRNSPSPQETHYQQEYQSHLGTFIQDSGVNIVYESQKPIVRRYQSIERNPWWFDLRFERRPTLTISPETFYGAEVFGRWVEVHKDNGTITQPNLRFLKLGDETISGGAWVELTDKKGNPINLQGSRLALVEQPFFLPVNKVARTQ
ncbi:hypothetical protein HY025_05575 [Candidatus Daviesbacteria bacterium]|nr:hypothetical protein [Candidatus Daviesbacteria bacterium]